MRDEVRTPRRKSHTNQQKEAFNARNEKIGIEMGRKKKHDTRDPHGSEMRGGWAELGLVGLFRYVEWSCFVE